MAYLHTRTLGEGKWVFVHKSAMSLWKEQEHSLAVTWHLCPVVLLSSTDTTRPRKNHEKEGVEYHFVSKQTFEADLHHNKYVILMGQWGLRAAVCLFIWPIFHLTSWEGFPEKAEEVGPGRAGVVIVGAIDSSVGKESTCSAGDPGLIPGSGRSAGEGIGYPLQSSWDSLVAQLVKNLPAVWEIWVQSLGWEDPLEKGKVPHSSILAWRIPWTV